MVNKDSISNLQAISILVLFMSSTSTVLMVALSAKGDFWLAIILSVLMAIAMATVFAQLHGIFPKQNYFYILEACFGKFLGSIVSILYIYFVLDEATMVLINAKQFITETTLEETPQTIVIIPIMILCAWIVKEGIGVIGKWAKYVVLTFMTFIIILTILLIPKMDLNNFEPMLIAGVYPLYEGTLSAFAFPFGELVMLSLVFSQFETKKSVYKVYVIGLLISGSIALIIASTTVLVLGVDLALVTYFPVYTAARVINIGNFIQRLEVVAVLISVVGAFLKTSILLLATCKGITKILDISDYRFIVIPISLMMINLSYIVFENRIAFVKYNVEVWTYIAIPFEVIIPILVLAIAKTRQKRLSNLKA